ncbi:hypothetical protein BGZ47_001061 [Haplosporangium gracile]|nr:hypothetical protein BGZ47_001061 [Haplosporangium gracile]
MLHNTSTDNRLSLFYLVDGEGTSNAFSVKIASMDTLDDFKEHIKTKKSSEFDDIAADKLILWSVSIPVVAANKHNPIVRNEVESSTELDPTDDISDVFPNKPPKETIHIIVQRPPPAPGWRQYTASDGKVVDSPPYWIDILASTEFAPDSRTVFDRLKNNFRAKDSIDVPHMGQTPQGVRTSWSGSQAFSYRANTGTLGGYDGDQEFTYRRVLSGLMGVGKSYLSYFLAAKAYSEGWLVLYLSDAGVLEQNKQDESALQVVKRFLAPNKDILTGAELEILVRDYNGTCDILTDAVSVIFETLLMSRDRKTLLLIDEHSKSFQKEPYVLDKFKSLVPLKSYHWWGEDAKGSRVVFTGTAHAKFEMEILDESHRPTSVVFVGSLSRNVFTNLLDMCSRLRAPAIGREVTAITNCVPRELVYLSANFKDLSEPISLDNL